MFDIAFSELMIIAAVALIVIGPERLPKVARTLGHLFGRMQRYVNDVKADISRELELEELRKLRTSMEDAARSFESSVTREVNSAESELQKIAQEANSTLPPPSESATTSDSASAAGAVPEAADPQLAPEIGPPTQVAADRPPAAAQPEPSEAIAQPGDRRA